MKLKKYLLSVIILFIFSTNAFAANETIEMLNKQDKERMVYSKKVVKINLGDTVFWKATDKGHNVEFIKGGVPEGVDKFKSKFNKDTEYKFTIPGIYTYKCTPHVAAGMVGVVIVGGDLSNMKEAWSGKYPGQAKEVIHELLSKYK